MMTRVNNSIKTILMLLQLSSWLCSPRLRPVIGSEGLAWGINAGGINPDRYGRPFYSVMVGAGLQTIVVSRGPRSSRWGP